MNNRNKVIAYLSLMSIILIIAINIMKTKDQHHSCPICGWTEQGAIHHYNLADQVNADTAANPSIKLAERK